MTILEFIDATSGYFAKNGVESPKLTAELLLAEGLKKKRLQLYMEFDKEVPPAVLDALRPLAKRRAQGEPLQYVQGFAEFGGARFLVTPDVLIPRPETELMLEAVAALLLPDGGPVADIGTGSGILAVSLARKFPALPIHAVDISEAALAIARKNGEGLDNLAFHHGDLAAPLPAGPFQAVVANLPYIPSAVVPTLPREVRQEPSLALDGGTDGLDLIRLLIVQMAGRTPLLALEVFEGHAAVLEPLLKEAGWPMIQVIKDLRETPRILIAKNT